jgi:hypothetical protein
MRLSTFSALRRDLEQLLCLIEKAVVNPVCCIDVPLGCVNLSPGWLCVQVDRLDLPSTLYHIAGVWWEPPPPPSLLQPLVAYLNRVQSNNFLVPWIAVTWTCASWFILTHHHPCQLQHLPSSSSQEKEKADSYFRLQLSCFWLTA